MTLNYNLVNVSKKDVVASFKVLCLEELTNTIKYLTHDGRPPERDFNPRTPEQEAEYLTTTLRHK